MTYKNYKMSRVCEMFLFESRIAELFLMIARAMSI